MNVDQIISVGTNAAIVSMIVLLVPTTFRVWVGPSTADRLQAVDAVTTILIGVVVLLAVILDLDLFMDVGLALAALSFISTVAIARYIGEGRVF